MKSFRKSALAVVFLGIGLASAVALADEPRWGGAAVPDQPPGKGWSGEKQIIVTYTVIYKDGLPVNVYQAGVRSGGEVPLKP